MKRIHVLAFALIGLLPAFAPLALQRTGDPAPVTSKMLENPSPNDWLMYNRTYDSQRYSPLKQSTNRMSVS